MADSATSSGLYIKSRILTSSEVKNLHGTPIEIIPAPGAGKYIAVVSVQSKLFYGGSNVFVAGAAQVISLYLGTTIMVSSAMTNGLITSSTTSYQIGYSTTNAPFTAAQVENQPLNAFVSSVTEISGNAANDNTITIACLYYIWSL